MLAISTHSTSSCDAFVVNSDVIHASRTTDCGMFSGENGDKFFPFV